ncbi:ribokinase [Trinickia symbiotica]|uniref:Ribokinase n=2 Tax=Trinickia symbiotica TaxID=863227 RepID=A0A2T3XXZ3_9BURK|nr:ribokinase [Trinickia symbiotica]
MRCSMTAHGMRLAQQSDKSSHAVDMETVISIGSINADFQMRVDEPPGGKETLAGRELIRPSGGKAANVAYLARLLGIESRLIGMVGDDDLAAQALDPLRRAGVDVSRVRVATGHATSVAVILVPPDGKKRIVHVYNANDVWDEAALAALEDEIGAAPRSAVVAVDAEIATDAAALAIRTATRRGLRVVLDPSPTERTSVSPIADLLPELHAITPNNEEATVLTGIEIKDDESAARAADALHARGIALACVKLADGGCVAAFDDSTLFVAATPVAVVDTTGAGDGFTGALSIAVARGAPPEEAVLYAAAVSHWSVTRYGSQAAYPGPDELQPMIERLRGGVRRVPRGQRVHR